jgi:hypothetical protein
MVAYSSVYRMLSDPMLKAWLTRCTWQFVTLALDSLCDWCGLTGIRCACDECFMHDLDWLKSDCFACCLWGVCLLLCWTNFCLVFLCMCVWLLCSVWTIYYRGLLLLRAAFLCMWGLFLCSVWTIYYWGLVLLPACLLCWVQCFYGV